MAVLTRGDRVDCDAVPYGNGRLQIAMPCCPSKVARVQQTDLTSTEVLPPGGFLRCPGCGWQFKIQTATKPVVPSTVCLEV